MGTRRMILLALAAIVVSASITWAQNSNDTPEAMDASTLSLSCFPVAAYWEGSPPTSGMPPGPNLAIISIDVRPKDATVHLDDRFVGRARYLDGKPGYLYVEPGSYRLELRFGGYRTVIVELDSTSGCRYDLKHRMERAGGGSAAGEKDTYGKGMPFDRVFGPVSSAEPENRTTRKSGADTSLRKDLDRFSGDSRGESPSTRASLRLRVTPPSASVSIDGEFVATAKELSRMEGPLATTAGKHQVVVRAPGYVDASTEFQLDEGEVLELEFSLLEKQTN